MSICTVERYSAVKRDEALTHVTICVNLKNMMLAGGWDELGDWD